MMGPRALLAKDGGGGGKSAGLNPDSMTAGAAQPPAIRQAKQARHSANKPTGLAFIAARQQAKVR
jgi:hypothetical protein